MAGTYAVVTGLLSTVEQALAGPGITIGGIGLSDMEVPEKLTWGGQQQLAVHRLIGGQRVIDAMGPDDRTLDWSGLLRGSNAVARARQLDALRTSGQQQTLVWADFNYAVVVQNFEADYTKQGYRVPYRISCAIVPSPPSPPQPTAMQAITADIGNAIGVPNLPDTVSSVMAAAQTTIQYASAAAAVVGAVTGGSSAFVAISGALGSATGALDAAGAVSSAALSGMSALTAAGGNIIGGTDALSGIAALTAAGSATQTEAAVNTASGYIDRASDNLAGDSDMDLYGFAPS